MQYKMQIKSVVAVVFTLSFLLTSCGGDGDTEVAPLLSTVEPLYSINGINWNDYVSDDGADMFSASDTLCNPVTDSACIHGGQTMSMVVPAQASCADLSAEDYLSTFEWVCDDSANPVRFISTGFKPGKGLSDLIDFNTAAFRNNYLTVYEAGHLIVRSTPKAWWQNIIVVNNDGSDGVSDMKAGEIHLITQNANATYTIGADRVALLIRPGVVLTGSATTGETIVTSDSRSFVWLEGSIDASGDTNAIQYIATEFSVLNRVAAFNATYAGVYLIFPSNNTISNITASNNFYGVYLDTNSINNTLSNITASNNVTGVYLHSAWYNTLSNITASNNSQYGFSLTAARYNKLSNITANSNNYGVHLGSSDSNTFTNVTASSNISSGIVLLSASKNNTLSNIAAINNYHGIYLLSSWDNTLSNITASNNIDHGVWLNGSGNNTLGNVIANGNNDYGVHLSGFRTSNNSLSNITASGNGSIGINLFGSSNNWFTGELQVGDNATFDCTVEGGTNPGLMDGTCANQGASDATLTTGIDLAGSFVDPTNGDFSLLASDAAIRDVLSVTTGADTFTHIWSDTSSTEMLRNAVEVQNDSIGNDNGLCESNETCLYTPNIAAYQGHGDLISAGTFTDGSVGGVTLLRYETNGY